MAYKVSTIYYSHHLSFYCNQTGLPFPQTYDKLPPEDHDLCYSFCLEYSSSRFSNSLHTPVFKSFNLSPSLWGMPWIPYLKLQPSPRPNIHVQSLLYFSLKDLPSCSVFYLFCVLYLPYQNVSSTSAGIFCLFTIVPTIVDIKYVFIE